MILHRVDGHRERSAVAGSKLLTNISSATNTCSVASLIASSVTKIGALFSLISPSSSGSKTRVMLVLLKSAKANCNYDIIIIIMYPTFLLLANGGD